MIVVTGATGHFGRSVVQGLLAKVPAAQIGISVREPEKAAAFAEQGVRVNRGDFAQTSSLAACFEGAEQVLLVSVNALGAEAIRMHENAIHAAKAAGVKRILYTSHQAASSTSKVAFARDHAATEDLLLKAGVPFVSLRNGFYAESCFYQLGGVQRAGELTLPEDGPVAWTVRDDLAAAAVATLLDQTSFDGVTPPLTSSRTYTFADVASLASEILGHEITRAVVSNDQYRQNAQQSGFPEPVAEMLVSMFAAMRDGEFNVVDPTLERTLGRQPTAFREVLRPFLTRQS